MDSYTFSSGKSLNKGYRDDWAKRLEDEAEKELERQAEANQKANAEKEQGAGKDFWKKAVTGVGNFVEESNKALLGGTIEGAAKTVNFLASGLNGEEADKRTAEFMKKTGLKDERGLTSMETNDVTLDGVKKRTEAQNEAEVIENETDTASKAGRIAGEVQKGALDIASVALPGMAAEKALRATKVAQVLLSGSKAAKIGTEAGLSVAGGMASTAAGAVQDPESLTAGNVGMNVGIDAALGVAAPVVGNVVKAVRNSKNSTELAGLLKSGEGLDIPAEQRKQLEDLASQGLSGKKFKEASDAIVADATAKADAAVTEVADDLANPLAKFDDAQLEQQIDEFHSAESHAPEDYAKYQDLKDELSARQRNNYFANGGLSKADAQKALDDFDAGNVPETAYKPAAPVSSIDEVLNRPDIPAEIKAAADEVRTDRMAVETQLDNLMSPQTKAQEVARLDEKYDMQIKELQQRYGANLEQPTRAKDTTTDQTISGQRLSGDYKSDVRFTVAKDRLDEDYRNSVAELDMLEAGDAEEVAKYSDMLEKLNGREQAIILDTRTMMKSAPDQFKDIDEVEAGAIREGLQRQLDEADRFDNPANIVTETATSPDPMKSFDKNPDAPEAFQKELDNETHHLEGYKNLTGLRQTVLRAMSPSQILNRMGLRSLHTGIVKAESALNLANKTDSETLTEIAKVLPQDAASQKQIIEYLEGKRQTLSGMDANSANLIKSFLDEKKAGLEKLGFKTIEDYFPHMIDKTDANAVRLFKSKVNGDIKFGNVMQRVEDSDNFNRDIMEVLSKYSAGYNKKTILEPALKPLDDIKLQDQVSQAEVDWVNEYIAQLKGVTPGSTPQKIYNGIIDAAANVSRIGKDNIGKNHYAKHLGAQRMVSALGTMGFNPGTAIRNMTQMVNTVADIGPRYSTIGMMDGMRALRAGPNSPEWKELAEMGVIDGGVSQNYFDNIMSEVGVKGKIASKRDAGVKTAMSLIRFTDIGLRSQAYYGAKALAKSKGLTGQAAKDFALEKVVDTQFMTSRIDMPTAFNGPGVRSMTQLATFSGKQAGFLKRMGVNLVKNDKGEWAMKPKELGNVLAAAGLMWGTTELLKPTIGFRETEWIPFYENIAAVYPDWAPGSEEIKGNASGDALYRSPLVTLLAGDDKGKMGLFEALSSGKVDEFFGDQWTQMVPGGAQIKKTTEGFGTTTSGVSRNSEGAIRYLQDMGIDDTLKASLFGQYATDAGRDWIKKGFPTLTDKQTEKVEQQGSRELQETYADYYQASKNVDYKNELGTGRQAAYDAAKAKALEGNANGAANIAAEYNAAVDKAMGEFWAKHQDMPDELREQMHNELRIKVNKLLDNAKKD